MCAFYILVNLKVVIQIVIFHSYNFRRKKAKMEDSRYEILLDPARTDVGVAKVVRGEETNSNVIMFKDTLEFDLSSNNQVAQNMPTFLLCCSFTCNFL